VGKPFYPVKKVQKEITQFYPGLPDLGFRKVKKKLGKYQPRRVQTESSAGAGHLLQAQGMVTIEQTECCNCKLQVSCAEQGEEGCKCNLRRRKKGTRRRTTTRTTNSRSTSTSV
jgi:hypothetical protein